MASMQRNLGPNCKITKLHLLIASVWTLKYANVRTFQGSSYSVLCTIDLIMLSRTGAKYRWKIFSFIDNEMETEVEMWRKSNTRRCLSTCPKILGKNSANVKLASAQVQIHYAELWPNLITEDYCYKDIRKYIHLNKHQFTSHNMNFPINICLFSNTVYLIRTNVLTLHNAHRLG